MIEQVIPIKRTGKLLVGLIMSLLIIIPVGAEEEANKLYFPLVINPIPKPGEQGTNIFFLSPEGDDNHSGLSEARAWKTFNRAWLDIFPGDTLILLDGVYYQSLNPNKRNGEPGKPITIKAKNDGKAIIDGEHIRQTVKLGDTWPGPIGNLFIIEGIVARNSIDRAILLIGTNNNILRRVSAYNANTDTNHHVISISGTNNLIEDCIAAGTGRKMIMIYQSDQNIIRRCFTYWIEWAGREFCGVPWPNGQSIQIYHGKENIIENSIAIGPVPNSSISIQANDPRAVAIGNKVLGTIAVNAGINMDGTVKNWGDIRPQPTDCTGMWDPNWPGQRVGFSLHGSGVVKDNIFQDIFSWGNAGLGFRDLLTGDYSNNQIIRATMTNNGLDNPDGPWPGQYGGNYTDVLHSDLEKLIVVNSYIEKIFINWPGYPNGERNMTSMTGEGARLTHRYIDGELTNIPLWPWPMEDRIQNELGFSLTEMITGLIFNNGSGYRMYDDKINTFSKNDSTIEFGKDTR
jgi:hypothetical protein